MNVIDAESFGSEGAEKKSGSDTGKATAIYLFVSYPNSEPRPYCEDSLHYQRFP